LTTSNNYQAIFNVFAQKIRLKLQNVVLVGTHHKTGTVWLWKIFTDISKRYSLKMIFETTKDSNGRWDIFFQDHSYFDIEEILDPWRGLHLIRDPRDIIVSGCFYHQISDEVWLNKPKPRFQGKTYKEKICSFRTIEDKLLFEMEHVGRNTINDMLKWDYNQKNFLEIKYEDLVQDHNLKIFNQIFLFLGFPENRIDSFLSIAYKHSIFSGKIKTDKHINSGEPNQWKSYFTPKLHSRFQELFPDSLTSLGYKS